MFEHERRESFLSFSPIGASKMKFAEPASLPSVLSQDAQDCASLTPKLHEMHERSLISDRKRSNSAVVEFSRGGEARERERESRGELNAQFPERITIGPGLYEGV